MEKLRPSPSESATLYKIGVIKTGNDGNKWIIVENKNGIKKWKKYKITSTVAPKKTFTLDMFYDIKITNEKKLEKIISKIPNINKIYKILQSKIIPEINKLGIKTFIIPLPLSNNNIYWTDYAYDFIKEKYDVDILDVPYFYFTFYLNNRANDLNYNRRYININFSSLNKEIKNKVINIFEKNLFGYYKWNGLNTSQMSIFFDKDK